MPGVVKKNIHVPLPIELHQGLKEQAERHGTAATTLARAAIEEWVKRQKRVQVAEELREYAIAMAGTGADLDEDLEAAGIEALLEHVP